MKYKFCLLTLISIIALLFTACATTNVPSLNDPSYVQRLEKDEKDLIRRSDRAEEELRRQGMILNNSKIKQYIESVADKLIPSGMPGSVNFHFGVLRDPTINAFAFAQGGIYVNTGLLARLENEAQLALVLSHEIAHTVERHQLKFLRSYKNKTIAAKTAELILFPAAVAAGGGGAGSLISTILGLTYAATVTGYGRENEEEADIEGLRLMARAGYSLDDAIRLFELLDEVKDPGVLDGFFFGSHPPLKTRLQYTRNAIKSGEVVGSHQGEVISELYQSNTEMIALENISLRLRARHYQYAIKEVQRAMKRYGKKPALYYYKGEAHYHLATDPEGGAKEAAFRMRKNETDQSTIESFKKKAPEELKNALESYRLALELDPSFVDVHRGIGLVAYAQGDKEIALSELSQYLEKTSKVSDRRYIDNIIKEISNEDNPS